MSATRWFAVILTTVIGLLVGCAAVVPQKQPEVPASVKRELIGKDIKEIPIYVEPATYYLFPGKLEEVSDPVSEAVVYGGEFFVHLKKYLRSKGFKVAESPCGKSCLSAKVAFMYSDGYPYIAYGARIELSYSSNPILLVERGILRNRSVITTIVYGTSSKYGDRDAERLVREVSDDIIGKWTKTFGGIATAAGG